ncbi:hypothetical protein BGZ60DRAFT_566919 [Tricladium varicosporioides]|nr:hypothetical protein BGZ60DRAFT_566919 [Hymenoscyphus varicosporioides]
MSNMMNTAIVHYSQTRKKACKGCVKGKRRCDLILPRCGRCIKRGVNCEYINDVGDAEADLDTFYQPPCSKRSIHNSSTTDGAPTRFQLPIDNMDFDASRPIPTFQCPSRVALSTLHMKYLSTYLRTSISSLALQNRTFFIHASFLTDSVPQPLLFALSVSALSTLNSPATFTVLDEHLSALVTSSHASFYRPVAILHSVQALIIFQIVRLFSLDEKQIAHAENDFHLLNRWTVALQTSYFSLPSSPTSYADWILGESIRRTIHISVLLRSLYCFTKDGYTELVPLIASLPVSSKGVLWEDGQQEKWKGSPEEEISTYWEYILRWSRGGVKAGGAMRSGYERVILCLEEDGKVGEAGWEFVGRVRSGEF